MDGRLHMWLKHFSRLAESGTQYLNQECVRNALDKGKTTYLNQECVRNALDKGKTTMPVCERNGAAPFLKLIFSGGILSSQRSEITNRSLKRRLRATANLCDFYNIAFSVTPSMDPHPLRGVYVYFILVQSDLSTFLIYFVMLSKENGEDHICSKDTAEMVFPLVNILEHALSMYAVEAFLMFEKEFIDGASYNYKEVGSSSCDRVLHACCVEQVPDQYINKRWYKGIKDGQNLDSGKSVGKKPMVCSSVWKMQVMRKMNSLIAASQMNINARAHCEKYFTELKKLIEFDNVLNPPGSCQKGVRNKRFRSIVEKKCDQVKQRKSNKLSMNDVASSTATPQNDLSFPSVPSYIGTSYSQMLRLIIVFPFNLPSTSLHIQHFGDKGACPLMSFHPTYYLDPSNGSSVFMPTTILPVFHQLHTENFLPNAAHNDKPNDTKGLFYDHQTEPIKHMFFDCAYNQNVPTAEDIKVRSIP
ncbi:hypothetical protein Cgig2_016223 [Carnegiea gigantea]|uniref:Protein FAR1-RELATED SEQUENCE n=1 Tax=Carnegiea gigantea TaxID=171969 RepID=A0A9Q1GSB2_9CARY|nr:hypothetical protein Cgig2_016223 [Carnegiea gigantea]